MKKVIEVGGKPRSECISEVTVGYNIRSEIPKQWSGPEEAGESWLYTAGGREPLGSMWEPTSSESAAKMSLYYLLGRKILNSLIPAINNVALKGFGQVYLCPTYFWSKLCFILFLVNLSPFFQSSLIWN